VHHKKKEFVCGTRVFFSTTRLFFLVRTCVITYTQTNMTKPTPIRTSRTLVSDESFVGYLLSLMTDEYILVAYERNTGGSREYEVWKRVEFLQHYTHLPSTKRQHHELIHPGKPLRPFFDLEVNSLVVTLKEWTALIEQIHRAFVQVMCSTYEVSSPELLERRSVWHAHRHGRFSTHVIYPDVRLTRPGDMIEIVANMKRVLNWNIEDKRLDDKPYSYTALKQIRMAYSNKVDKSRQNECHHILKQENVIQKAIEHGELFSFQAFVDSLVTYSGAVTTSSAVPPLLVKKGNTSHSAQTGGVGFFPMLRSVSDTVSSSSSSSSSTTAVVAKKARYVPIGTDMEQLAKIKEWLQRVYEVTRFDVEDPTADLPAHVTVIPAFTWLLHPSVFCPGHGDRHSSNGTVLNIYTFGKEIHGDFFCTQCLLTRKVDPPLKYLCYPELYDPPSKARVEEIESIVSMFVPGDPHAF
jgi:hypothetical protein